VSQLSDSSIQVSIKPWVAVQDFAVAPAELYSALIEAFRENRIQIPFPQRELRVLNFPENVNAAPAAFPSRSTTGI
jgi:small conductance mechanosensitive channel